MLCLVRLVRAAHAVHLRAAVTGAVLLHLRRGTGGGAASTTATANSASGAAAAASTSALAACARARRSGSNATEHADRQNRSRAGAHSAGAGCAGPDVVWHVPDTERQQGDQVSGRPRPSVAADDGLDSVGPGPVGRACERECHSK